MPWALESWSPGVLPSPISVICLPDLVVFLDLLSLEHAFLFPFYLRSLAQLCLISIQPLDFHFSPFSPQVPIPFLKASSSYPGVTSLVQAPPIHLLVKA